MTHNREPALLILCSLIGIMFSLSKKKLSILWTFQNRRKVWMKKKKFAKNLLLPALEFIFGGDTINFIIFNINNYKIKIRINSPYAIPFIARVLIAIIIVVAIGICIFLWHH